jgi:hypothetical protein
MDILLRGENFDRSSALLNAAATLTKRRTRRPSIPRAMIVKQWSAAQMS